MCQHTYRFSFYSKNASGIYTCGSGRLVGVRASWSFPDTAWWWDDRSFTDPTRSPGPVPRYLLLSAAGKAVGEWRPLVAEGYPWLADPLHHFYVDLDDECLDDHDEFGHGAEASFEHPQQGVRDRRDDACAGGGLVLRMRRSAALWPWLARRRL